LKTKLSLLPKKLFRIRMSRNFGMKMLTMTNLSTECLIQLTKLGYDATPFNQILKQNAKREMRLRLGKVTRSEERFSRNAETDLVCRLLLEKKKNEEAYSMHNRDVDSTDVFSPLTITLSLSSCVLFFFF